MVAADSIKITTDHLNNFYFSVKISVPEDGTSSPSSGFIYNIHASYGVAEANGTITMPAGGEHLKPILRNENEQSFIIGFIPGKEYGGDSLFHEYYRVEAQKGEIAIKALKSFTIR